MFLSSARSQETGFFARCPSPDGISPETRFLAPAKRHSLTSCYLPSHHFGVQSGHHSYDETNMKVTYRDKQWELDGRWRVRDVIKEVGLIPQAVLAVRNGKLLTEDTMVDKEDEIKLVAVISGG